MGEVLSKFSNEPAGADAVAAAAETTSSQQQVAALTASSQICPVKRYCETCGWAGDGDTTVCPRCSNATFEDLQRPRPAASGGSNGDPPASKGGDNNAAAAASSGQKEEASKPDAPKPASEAKTEDPAKTAGANAEVFTQGARPPAGVKKKLLNVNRRSRAYSRQFVMNVANDPANAGGGGDLAGSADPAAAAGQPGIAEEDPSVRPVVRKIVELTPQYQTDDGVLVVKAIEKILTVEKLKGTKCLEIADEVYMELIINEVNGYNFVAAMLNVFDVSFEDFGLFLATPPDEGTMSLLEEAVCQESLDLFYEVLKMGKDAVLKGVLSCKELPEEVRQEVLDLMNDAGSDPGAAGEPVTGSY